MLGITFLSAITEIKKHRHRPFQIDRITKVDLADGDRAKLFVELPAEYPIERFEIDGVMVVLEGRIYNHTLEEIKLALTQIVRHTTSSTVSSAVQQFQYDMVGEYLVVMALEKNFEQIYFFNDYFGRLPTYYYQSEDLCIVSRNIQAILEYVPTIEIDDMVHTDLALFGYPLGTRSLVKGVSSFDGGVVYVRS